MDAFWHDVADFLVRERLAGNGTVAPAEFSPTIPVAYGYPNVGVEDAARVETLILHKGRYRELDPDFLRQALARLRPVFANAVFIVFAADGKDIPLLGDASPHLGDLSQVRAWAATATASTSPAAPASKRRMAPVYVGNETVLAETVDGHLILLPARDRSITPHMIRDGYFDLNLTHFLQHQLRPGMTYIDVGANIGVYALLAASQVGSAGRVIAIEALPRLRNILIDNFSMNGFLDRATVLSCAAADRAGEITIHDFHRMGGASTVVTDVAQLQERLFSEAPTGLSVPSAPLSALLEQAQIRHADLIKIDVEGFEWEVLQGARDFLREQPTTALIVEWHTPFMSGERQRLLYDMLAGEFRGRIEIVEANGSTRHTDFDELRALHHADLWVRLDRSAMLL